MLGISASVASSWLAACGEEQRGQSGKHITLSVEVPGGRMAGPLLRSGTEWAQDNKATLDVIEVPGGNVYEKVMTELTAGSGAFDILLHPYFMAADLVAGGFLVPLSQYLQKGDPSADYEGGGVQWDEQLPPHREINMWAQNPENNEPQVYHINFDGDHHMGFYRKDLWQKFGEEFEQANGYALRVDDPGFPETWDQYYDIAAFFQNKDVGGGQKVFGHMDINVRSRASTWHFLWRYTTRLLHNSEKNMQAGDVFFDQDSMEPLINNEAGLRAMEDLLESATAKYSPPNAKALGWAEMQELWTSGQLSMGVTWPAMSKIAGDPERNKELPGGMEASGAFMLPGTKEVFDTSKNTWVTLPGIRRMPMLAWGWCFSITTTCEDPARAFDLIRYMATGDRRVDIELAQGEEYESYMDWEFRDPEIKKFYSKAPSFLDAHRQNQLMGVPDLRIPGSIQMYDAVEIHKGRALDGAITAQQAVDNIAADWSRLVKERGVDTMRNAYKASVTRRSL